MTGAPKGTVSRDFLPLVFFFKLFLLGPVDMLRNNLDFFRLFADIFNYFGDSLASVIDTGEAPLSSDFTLSMTGPIRYSDRY